MSATDLNPTSRLIATLPENLRPYAFLSRWDRPIGVWLLFWPGVWSLLLASQGVLQGIGLVLLFLVGAVAMRGAGCTINDMMDRKMDAAVARTATRPLASGTLNMQQALGWLVVQLLVGAVVLFLLPEAAITAGLWILPLIVFYPLMKRITWWPQAVLGLTFNWGVWLGWLATGSIITPAPLFLYVGAFCWTVAYDTIYAWQDRDDDEKIGIKSTARLMGNHVRTLVAIGYGLALTSWLAAGLFHGVGLLFYAAMVAVLASMIIQFRIWRLDNPATSLVAFKMNHATGAFLAFGCLLGRIW